MTYNLTENQIRLARDLVKAVREKAIGETFYTLEEPGETLLIGQDEGWFRVPGTFAMLRSLTEENLLSMSEQGSSVTCVFKQKIYKAVDSNFVEDQRTAPISTLAQPHPPEIAMSLDRLRAKYPDPKKLGFLIMRFTAAKPFQGIVEAIKKTAKEFDVDVIRADEQEFHADLWGNVRTYLHGCGFGIAIYERIETNEPNANVGLEVGYLMAMNKPVLLLKDKTVDTLQADLAGKLYNPFDPHDPEGTIPDQLKKWLQDNGVVVPK